MVPEVMATDIPVDMEALVNEKRKELIEAVSEVDDQLAEAFLSDEPITSDELMGVQPLLDGVLSYLPCPSDVCNYALDQTKNEEKVTLTGTPDGPLVALAFKLGEGRFGQLTYLRFLDWCGCILTRWRTFKKPMLDKLLLSLVWNVHQATLSQMGQLGIR